MFRRLPNQLPKDVSFPADLAKLGYFVNDKDVIRQIADPEKKYQYKINRSDRINDVYKEAMNTCTRQIVSARCHEIGLEEIRLPLGAGKDEKHVPILVSKDIASKRHVMVLFAERHIDLGILSYRIIGDEGINAGSVINLVKHVLYGPNIPKPDNLSDTESDTPLPATICEDSPGIMITNPGQLTWYRRGGRAVTDREWACLPRESYVHEAVRVDEVKNRVKGNKDFRQHVHYIFDHVMSRDPSSNEPQICHPQARFSLIGLELTGTEMLQFIVKNWFGWRSRINCIALVNPQHTLDYLFEDFNTNHGSGVAVKEQITEFIASRCRAYRVSPKEVEALLSGRQQFGCNVYASGEHSYEESAFVRCWPSILDFIEVCKVSETYSEPMFEIKINEDEDVEEKVKSPRRMRTQEEREAARFHGELVVDGESPVQQV